MSNDLNFFGFKQEPFRRDLAAGQLMCLPGMSATKKRIQFSVATGSVCIITGDIGLGKSSCLRWSCADLHPSANQVVHVTATNGSAIELYRMLAWEVGLEPKGISRAKILREIREVAKDLVERKKKRLLVCVDEANLLRSDVLGELHTLSQLECDSKNLMALVLCGQNSLLSKLRQQTALALASRVTGRSHLEPLRLETTKLYVQHHLDVIQQKHNPFEEAALHAIQQGSGGVPRRINALARGGLLAAAANNEQVVTAEHIRIASSELI
jgi:type II secretory pathway predicted ATPase ExeA